MAFSTGFTASPIPEWLHLTRRAAVILVAPLLAGVLALFVGAYEIAPARVVAALLAGRDTPEAAIIWTIRLPRVLLSGIVGAVLAGAGTTLQAVFRNPLVDPFLLGISAGAALGCALGVAFLPWVPLPLLAFLFATLAVALSWALAGGAGGGGRLALVLSGVVVSALFTAMVSLVKSMLDPLRLQTIIFWLMGSFSLADWPQVELAFVGAMVGLFPIFLFRWRLNLLSLGDAEAASLGMNVTRMRLLLVAGSTLAVAVAVSVSGIVGWVGLMVPHLVRMACGAEHRRMLPLSFSAGAAFLITADSLARSLVSWEVPVGVVTALAGAPFFILLMRRRQGLP